MFFEKITQINMWLDLMCFSDFPLVVDRLNIVYNRFLGSCFQGRNFFVLLVIGGIRLYATPRKKSDVLCRASFHIRNATKMGVSNEHIGLRNKPRKWSKKHPFSQNILCKWSHFKIYSWVTVHIRYGQYTHRSGFVTWIDATEGDRKKEQKLCKVAPLAL